MPAEEFAFIERYLRETWAQESEKNEIDQERDIEYIRSLFGVIEPWE